MAYFRSALMAFFYLPFLIGTSLLILILNFFFRSRRIDDRMMQSWGRNSCRMFGVQVQVQGLENLKLGEGAVLVFNHSSFFDIFALAEAIPGLRFGAKIELFRIPIFGAAMRKIGILPIDRARKESVFRVYDEATARVQSGEMMALAPEGGRSKTGGISPFKSGPFVFAIQAQVPVLPVVVFGASEILPKGALVPNRDRWARVIEVCILPRVPTASLDLKRRPELQDQVHQMMSSQFLQRQGKKI